MNKIDLYYTNELNSSSTWNPEAITFDTMRLGSQEQATIAPAKESRKENQCHLISFYISRLYLFATGIANKQKEKKELTAFSNDL